MQNIRTVILGGGRGTRLFPLTKDRAKPSVPIAGKFRLIDIPLSNCIHSELDEIFILTQFNSASLIRHISETYHFGLVTSRSVQIGETASPGAVLLTLADLDRVELTVFIPENRLGEIRLGQKVTVEVDSFPGKEYQGEVVYISSEAEFTPRNVQTKEERVNTVFAAKVRLPNPEHELKPGMPADATFER